MGPIPPKGTPERTAWFVELASRRKDRQEPRPTPRDGRTRMFVAGSPEEEHWERRARTLGLSDEGMTRQGWRRLVFRLAAADAAHVAELVDSGVPLDPTADLLTFFLEREAVRLRDRARRDRAIADAHDKAADQAETRLVQHLRATKGKKR